MARGGLYKTDIEKARNAVIAEGRHPSVDAVRVELGNTGSKTTIHRYLKELDEEQGQSLAGKVAISDALQDLVTRLSARLHEEAEALITEAKGRFDGESRRQADVVEQRAQENVALSDQIQRGEVALQTERAEHGQTRQALIDAHLANRQLEERVAGLQQRVAEHETHTQSLEEKHRHAREALEHYRTSVKEQREQEHRRHEHQVQSLQVDVRAVAESITAKNHELLQLNRDNARMLEQGAQQEKDLAQARRDQQTQQHAIEELRPLVGQNQRLQESWLAEQRRAQSLQSELEASQSALARERTAHQQREADLARVQARLSVLEDVFGKLRIAPEEPQTSAVTE
ncbi:DNA-binding protein [Pseudolysobacter antarcticus]|uniref:DNA-binding protein n=1 Tax=Pseudolysobacter antarcticus TaxID=2511995 RepID=A0A411HJJ5_9GAMM|nr:DNA-binding protein [Pseudolysobacter antarcticus]QBB70706.1 DNA-binding protein [Pseudolysobacter antarcticus]